MGKLKNDVDSEKKLLLLQQDLKIVKALMENNQKVRERVLKNLPKWFEDRSTKIDFTEEDFVRLWGGLFNTMWMADKPLIQEECAERISKLIHFRNPNISLLFFKCGLQVLSQQWFGIDQLRLDKFLMFVRRIVRQALEVLKKNDWDVELIMEFGNILLETVLKKNNSTHLGLTMHITEIYLEELSKISNGELEKHLVAEFLRPFVKQLSMLEDNRQVTHIRKYLFHHLLRQTDEGMEYNIRFDAWKERGFPGGTIESMEKIEASDDEDMSDISDEVEPGEKPLDPRAGHVNVDLPQLQFDPDEISQLLLEYKFAQGSTSFSRKIITKLIQNFESLTNGVFPLGIKEIRMPEYDGYSTTLKKSVNRLVKFEKQVLADSSKNHKRKLKLKKAAENLKKLKTDDDLLPGMAGMFQNKLAKFIAKSEGNLSNGTNKKKKRTLNGNRVQKRKVLKKEWKEENENQFLRNSGMWFVERYDDLDDSNRVSEKSDSLVSGTALENGNVDRMPKIKKKQKHNELLFPQNEWDLPLKEGEVEIFVPSNKRKIENLNTLLNTYKNKIRYSLSHNSVSINNLPERRLSMDERLIKNPFAKPGVTPKSEKRVKIDLKLNKSQEIHEHQARLRSSPAIPYDATKRPSKPLLKANAINSPINPFYKRKSKLF